MLVRPLEVLAQPGKLVCTCLVVVVCRQACSPPLGQRLLESLGCWERGSATTLQGVKIYRVPPCAFITFDSCIILEGGR